MQLEDEEWVTHTLKDYERKQSISKVLSTECKAAVPKGNNYGSDIFRITLTAVLNSGEVVKRPVIYKALPKSEIRRKLLRLGQYKESKMFTDILPQIESLRLKSQCGAERISPVCYGIKRGREGILLEDLTILGYKMADRIKGLDFDHAKLAMKNLAEFHAASKILIDSGDLVLNDVREDVLDEVGKQLEVIFTKALKDLIITLEEQWKGEWLHYAAKLKEILNTLMPQLKDCVRLDDSNFNALLHGDCWTTNMLFRYNKEGQPVSLRFLDFQMSRYNNVGIELVNFFNTSLSTETFPRMQQLLEIYHEKLTAALSLYGYNGKLPTFEEISECCKRGRLWGMAIALTFRPQNMQPQEEIPDLEEWTKEFFGDSGMKVVELEGETRKVIECILKEGII